MAETQSSGRDPQLPPRLTQLALTSGFVAGISITVYVVYNIFICGCG